MSPDCQLTKEPFFQCCCNCVYHRPVHFHCCTEPKPTEEQKKAIGHDGSRCVCGVVKSWACVGPESDRIYDNWGEHSCGCELYTERKPSPEAEAAREAYYKANP